MDRDTLILQHLPLVPMTRQRQIPNAPGHLVEDLEGEGYLALVKAADAYSPARQTKFSSYAIPKIAGAMREFLRRDDWVPRVERERERRGEPALVRELVSLEFLLTGPRGDQTLSLRQMIDPSPQPEARVLAIEEAKERRRRARWTLALLALLPPKERFLIESFYMDGIPQAEAAARLGVAVSTLANLRRAAVRKWQRLAEPEASE